MRISFSIPAYNEEHRIARCLESVQKEIVRAGMESAAEVVVINNASTDRTREIALGFPGVKVVDEPRKGLVKARQAGFLHTAGELLANVDSDTMVPPGWLDTVLREFERDSDLVALSGPFFYFDLSPFQRLWVRVFYAVGYVTYLTNKYVLRTGAMLQGGNFIVRRSAMQQIGGFDTSIQFYGEDTDVARRLNAVGNVVWTFRLPTWASGRRLAHEGMVTIGLRYALNYLWVIFAKRPWSEEYLDIRTDWRD
jgi:cellulose synthase/poly-beta-1,6-N-acetylglucosamine synthase-like glycosyltransferase